METIGQLFLMFLGEIAIHFHFQCGITFDSSAASHGSWVALQDL